MVNQSNSRNILVALFLSFSCFSLSAQNLPVSQNAQNKKAVLEEFTGYKCGNCPEGHQIANAIQNMYGKDSVISIRYHRGGLATPSGNDPDFRTDAGNALGSFYNVLAVPMGLVNRTMLERRTTWSASVGNALMQTADVNVALDVSIDAFTREVTVNTETFYTTNSNTTHYLTVGYVQNEVIAPQTSYNPSWNADFFNSDGSYRHQHLFRGYLNGDTGTALDANATGVISNNYSFTVPADLKGNAIDLQNLEFFAFVHEGLNGVSNSEILNAALVSPSINGTVGIEEDSPLISISVFPNPSNNGFFKLDGLKQNMNVSVTDVRGSEVTFELQNNNLIIDSKGIYFVQIVQDGFSKTLRVVSM